MIENPIVFTDEALTALRERVGKGMSEKRYRHTLGVERMAARLCGLYCPGQTSELRAAALLHDITKEETLENQLHLCEKFAIMVTPMNVLTPKTFHAKTAAALVPELYPDFATPTVVSAIRWHTTGHADMTLAEQLLYLADYIDDSRTFPDCVALREMFFSAKPDEMDTAARLAHLSRVMIASFDMTVRGLLEEGAPIDADTVACRNDLILKASRG